MLYFAYGADLDPEQICARAAEHRVVGLAALRDHQLAFPRYSPEWDGGVASVQSHHGDTVWGIVYDLTEAGLARLDGLEGFRAPGDQHNVSERQVVLVELTRPDDGSVPRRLRAFIYVARPSNPAPPSARYRAALDRGARHHRLPEEYVARLSGLGAGEAPEA